MQKWAIIFKRWNIMAFEILTSDFWSRGKTPIINYCLYECKHIITENWKNKSSPHPIMCIASKFVCNITTKQFIYREKK